MLEGRREAAAGVTTGDICNGCCRTAVIAVDLEKALAEACGGGYCASQAEGGDVEHSRS